MKLSYVLKGDNVELKFSSKKAEVFIEEMIEASDLKTIYHDVYKDKKNIKIVLEKLKKAFVIWVVNSKKQEKYTKAELAGYFAAYSIEIFHN